VGKSFILVNNHHLRPGLLAWLPRRSRRQISAGRHGLTYLTVHGRRQALTLDPSRG
jgi:hypothetical protein